MCRFFSCVAVSLCLSLPAPLLWAGQATPGFDRSHDAPRDVLPRRERARVVNRLIRDRLDHLLPRLMREADVDLWLVVSREYAEDPIHPTLVPRPYFSSKGLLTFLIFHDRGPEEGVERLAVGLSSKGVEDLYQWEGAPGGMREQWRRLREILTERDPQKIAVNTSLTWAPADGLSATLRDVLQRVLGPELAERMVSAQDLAVRWLETRTEAELELYPHVVALTREVIAEGLSERAITPGVTTTRDLAWYLRQRLADLDLPIWFMPIVDVQRPKVPCAVDDPYCGDDDAVIQRGDVVHTDVGICYLTLCSDTQELAYVLRLGETEVPAGLRDALAQGNRWQDLLTAELRSGRTGNEILTAVLDSARAEGIESRVYSHPVGFFGHAPGPAIGLLTIQEPVPFLGDWPVHPSTVYAIEGAVQVPVPEWDGHPVRILIEHDAVFDGEDVVYLAGRQTRWHVIH